MKRDMKQSNTESVGDKPTSSKARMRKRFDKVVAVMCTIAMVFAMVPNVALGNDDALFEAMQQGESESVAAASGDAQTNDATAVVQAASEEADAQQATNTSKEADTAQAESATTNTKAESGATEQKATEYPAVTFDTEHANGVAVNVSAPKGALPEGAKLVVTGVSAASVLGTVNDVVEGNVTTGNIAAVDISFTYEDPATGKTSEIEPKLPVTVKLASDGIREAQADADANVDIVHIPDAGSAEVIPSSTTASDQVQISSQDFSVYAIVTTVTPRLTVTFQNGASENPAMTIKANDTAEEVESIIYDPGVEGLASNEIFRGWTTDPNYTADTELLTIAEVREAAMNAVASLTGDSSVTYYPAIFKQYKIDYVDESGVSQGAETVEVPSNLQSGEGTYTVNMGYTPTDPERNFEGWLVSEGKSNIAGYEEGHVYKNGDTITVTGDVKFSVSEPLGHWLVFDENGKGGTYNAPEFVKAGEVTTKPCDDSVMVRFGYTFGGWFTDQACTAGHEFAFGSELAEGMTIYAKWIPNATANYTVIIWKQNLNADGYDFEEAITLSGRVGSTVNTVSKQGNGDNAYARINGTNKQYTGFHLDSFDQNVTITTEGNAVVNVYYDRTQYTLTFRKPGGWFSHSTTYKTITALYGQYIGDNFPITDNGADAEWRWDPQDSETFDQVLVYIDVMPAENVTFDRSTSNASTKYMEFYVEALPGQAADRTWNGKSFVKYGNTIPAKYGFFTEAEDFVELTGYEKYGSDPAFVNGRADVDGGATIRFYYTRNSYTINYMDGVYVDGNGNALDEMNRGQLGENDGISFGADLSSYNAGGANYFAPECTGYAFEGWYMDPECTQAYNFTTMPEGGVTVYAKWRQVQYRVFLHPNAGTQQSDPSLDWGSTSQSMNFRVGYEGTVSLPNTALRDGYEFVGWYSDAACTKVFNENTKLTDAIATDYNKLTDFTDVMDQWGNGATYNSDITGFNGSDRFWITKRVDVYAKWRAVLVGADGINVLYDANTAEGGKQGSQPTDTSFYTEAAYVTAASAAQPADPTAKRFKCWVVQTWDEASQSYVDTDKMVLPGESFEIHQADARVVERSGSTPEDPKYTYTVQLKAVYEDVEEKTPTHIDWYSNYGTENEGKGILYHSDSDLSINEAVNIQSAPTREGYTFMGWTKTRGGTEADFLAWDGEQYTTTVDGETYVVTQVAADEKQPYEDLYAVWQPSLNVQITGNTSTVTYNGSEQSVTGYTVTYMYAGGEATSTAPEGVTVTLKPGKEAVAKGTDASEQKYMMGLTLDDFEITAPGYNYDPTNAFNTYTDGWLKIDKQTLDVTAITYSGAYDGQAHEGGVSSTLPEGTTLQYTTDNGETWSSEAPSITNVGSITYAVKATNPNYQDGIALGTLTVTKKAVTVTAQNKEFTYNGTAQSWSGYDVTGLVGDDAINATVAGSITFPSQSPVANVVTSYEFTSGNAGNYAVTTANGELTMKAASQAITITAANGSKTYDGTALTASGVTVTEGTLFAGDTLVAEANGSATNVADTAAGNNPVAAGYKVMHGTEDVTASYVITPVAGTLTINPKAVTITAQSKAFAYTGQAQSWPEYDVAGLVGDDAISVTVTGSITFPSESPVANEVASYEFTSGTAGNYSVTTVAGELTMTNASQAITITAASDSKTYDGTALTAAGVTVTEGSLLPGDTLVAIAEGSATNVADTAAGNNPVAAGYVIMHGDEDVTANYAITTQAGTLTIEPKAVTVTAASEEFTYDGVAHSNDGFQVAGLVGSDAISATVAGFITFPSQSPVTNEVTGYEFTAGDPDNYSVTTANGELTMSNASQAITITAASDSKTYDGTALTASDVTVTSGSLFEGDELVAEATGSATNVADTAAGNNPVAEGYKVMHGTEDVTANYNVTTQAGTLTIQPKAVTITAQDKAFTYNGTAQSWGEYDVDGLVGDDAISATVAGSITFPSESPVANEVASYEFTSGTAGNYSVTTANGELTMANASQAITITAASDSKTYDGAALTASDVSITEGSLLPGDELVAEATGSATNVADTVAGNNPISEGYLIMHGDEDVTASYVVTTQAGTLTINPKAVTITAASEEFTYDGTAHSNAGFEVEGLVGDDAISATVTGSITFPSQSPVANKVEGYSFTTGTAGNYSVSTANGELTMANASQEITIAAASDSKTYDGTALTAAGVTVSEGALFEGDELVAEATGSATNVADSTEGNNPVAAGYKVMHGTEDVTASYSITAEAGTLTIEPAAVTITAQSKAFAYTGQAQSWPEYDVAGLVGDDAISATVTGSITFPSESPVANVVTGFEFATGTAGNYNVSTVDGELTMSNASQAITITAASDSKTYDGTALTAAGVTVTEGGLLPGDELVAEATGSATDVADTAAGNNPVAAGYKVMHGTEDVTANYAITPVAGTLTINPKAVTVTAASEEFTYDGTAHSNDGFQVEGLVGSDAISATVTGSITFPSQSPVTNVVTGFEFTAGDPDNYSVTTANGELTMSNASQAITITAASDSKTYDGTALTASGVTVTEGTLFAGDTLVAEANGSATNVADTAAGNNPVAAGYKVMHGTEDVTASYSITAEAGTLTIEPKAVTITAQDKAFTYNGTPQSWGGYDVAGLVGSDAISATVTGSITFPSESPVANVVTGFEFTAGDPDNYSVTTANGELTMSNASQAITITAASDSKTYDGTALTAAGVTVTEGTLFEGDELVATAEGSATNVADTAAGNNPVAAGYAVMHDGMDVTASYAITAQAGTLTIEPKAATITVADASKVYGEADPTFTGVVDGLVNDNDLGEVAYLRTNHAEDVDVYEEVLDATYTANENYSVTVDKGDFEITPAQIPGEKPDPDNPDNRFSVFGPSDAIYNGLPQYSQVIIFDRATQEYLVEGTDYTLSYSDDVTNVGQKTVAVNCQGKYSGTMNLSYQVIPAKITIKADGKTKVYDNDAATDPELTATVSGVPANGVAPVYQLTRESGQDVDDYAISVAASADDNPNYTVATEGATFQITPAAITIKADDKTKVYDNDAATDPELTATVTGVPANGVAPVYQLTREAGQEVNDYAISVLFVADDNPNYQIATEGGTFSITPAVFPDVKPDPDDPNARFTVTGPDDAVYNGLAQAMPVTIVDTTTGATLVEGTDYTLEYSEDVTNVGTKEVRVIGMGDYAGEMHATYAITPAALNVTTGTATKVFDGTALTAPVTYEGLAVADEGKVTIAATGSQTAVGSSQNTYKIDWGEVSSDNYVLTDSLGTLTVTAAVVPGGVTPAGFTPVPAPGAPAAITPAAAGPAATIIPDDATPLAGPEESILDDETPLAADDAFAADSEQPTCWVHWAMAFGILASAVIYAVAIARRRSFTNGLGADADSIRGLEPESKQPMQDGAKNAPAYKEV
ncbi:Listeria/Bacterioides repeat-containing protein [Denitrobacterium detoxificans]|uniref:Listeria/Bacterioides repeat-containing protein n=2 Tax=Denitrobacterium detoxificans TaxID=79604 RepID=A0A1H8PSZ3_9ACTN|nr:Listeria/Bacterioides repeat-containing protein [Denitrobacterium detoxificans]